MLLPFASNLGVDSLAVPIYDAGDSLITNS